VQNKKVGTELEAGGAPAWSRLSAGFFGKSRVQLGALIPPRARPAFFSSATILHGWLMKTEISLLSP
jgi:hypothetical protein